MIDKELKNSTLYIRGVPEDTKTDFKVWCARRKVSMTEAISELLKQIVTGKIKPEVSHQTK